MLDRYYAKATTTLAEEPFRCKGYVPSGVITNADEEDIVIAQLPPFLRTLLVTDGTVTKSLEAYYWEPIVVETVDQEVVVSASEIDWLNVKKGEEILARRVRLMGNLSQNSYVYAYSIIRLERLPADLRRGLLDGVIGIGEIIRDCGLESYREIMDLGTEDCLPNWGVGSTDVSSEKGFVYRTYRIVIHGRPTILVTENFPIRQYSEVPPTN